MPKKIGSASDGPTRTAKFSHGDMSEQPGRFLDSAALENFTTDLSRVAMGRMDHVTYALASTASDPVREDTAQMFGMFCHRSRLARRISQEGVEDQVNREPTWYEALERGEFVPTLQMATEIDSALGPLLGSNGARRTLVELELEPMGPLARRLRREFDMGPYQPDSYETIVPIGRGLLPTATSIRGRDRLLVSGPLTLCMILLTVQTTLALWSQEVLGDVAVPALPALAAIALAVLAMTLPFLDRVLSATTRAARTSKLKEIYADYLDTYVSAGLKVRHKGCWFHGNDAVHYLPDFRADALRFGLRTDSFERTRIVLLLNSAVACGIVLATGIEGRSIVNLIAFIALAAATLIGTRNITSAAYSAERAVSFGLGATAPVVGTASLLVDTDSESLSS